MRYSKILLAIVLISILVFGSTMSAFAVDMYTLKVFVAEGSEGMGTVTGSGDYAYDANVNVSAIPNEGYHFVGWEVCFNGAGMNPLDKPASFTCNLASVNEYVPNVYMRATFEAHESSSILLHYINESLEFLTPEEIIYGPLGSPYVTSAKTFAGYELKAVPSNATGVFAENQIHIDYIYKVVTTEPTTEPTTAPTTEPTTEPTTAPTTAPTTEPTTAPTTGIPTTEPTTAPTTGIPTTEPTTAPTTEAPTQPTTAATTAAATEEEDDVVTITFIPTTSPATTETEATEVVTEEGVPLGAPGIVNFDEIFEDMDFNFDEFVEDETMNGTDVMVDDGEEILDGEVPLAEGLPQTGQVSADMFYGIGGVISGLGLWLKRKK